MLDVDSLIAAEARKIIRQAMKQGWTAGEEWSIKPADAIHIATALAIKATYLFTDDARLL